MILLGTCYCICASSLWPSVQVLVEKHTVGTANGIATSMQMLGIGLCNIAVGVIKDKYGYTEVMWFFCGMGGLSFLVAILLNLCDTDGVLKEGEIDKVKMEPPEEPLDTAYEPVSSPAVSGSSPY